MRFSGTRSHFSPACIARLTEFKAHFAADRWIARRSSHSQY
jgi:hypothetical protein